MIAEMEQICIENGTLESHQSINWSKVFLSITLFHEQKYEEALELLETT